MLLSWRLCGGNLYSYDVNDQTYYVNKCRNQIDDSKVIFRGKGNQLVVQEKQNNKVDAGKNHDYFCFQ